MDTSWREDRVSRNIVSCSFSMSYGTSIIHFQPYYRFPIPRHTSTTCRKNTPQYGHLPFQSSPVCPSSIPRSSIILTSHSTPQQSVQCLIHAALHVHLPIPHHTRVFLFYFILNCLIYPFHTAPTCSYSVTHRFSILISHSWLLIVWLIERFIDQLINELFYTLVFWSIYQVLLNYSCSISIF